MRATCGRRNRLPEDQDLVAPLLGQVMDWSDAGVPVDTIVIRIRRHLADQPSRVRLIKELRRLAHSLGSDNRWGRAQHPERIVEAMERPSGG